MDSTQEAGEGVLAGRVVLITGANGGLGEAAARACAAAGATVVLVGRRVPKLNKLYDALASIGPEPAAYPLDLEGAGPEDYETMAEALRSQLGRLDGILHAAVDFKGLTPLANTAPLDFARALHVNLTAPCLLTQACLPLLKQAPDAAVVFVLDELERIGKAYWGGYGVSKHGLLGLMRILHDETRDGPVRVSALEPGPMRTGLRAKAFMNEALNGAPGPGAYAAACVHLLSPAGAAQRGTVHVVREGASPGQALS
ncbi:SDR family NAD(P)-dependent oxidoreductase [Coralloluteibacterium thermophilus]|uniref:SDR family NAD(P)-dependent oxidoreductase n=1 Tax=Coralloluteibacterium thermophilum TaxID=2707049 RepID=A0ABV9NHW0_9GAMM